MLYLAGNQLVQLLDFTFLHLPVRGDREKGRGTAVLAPTLPGWSSERGKSQSSPPGKGTCLTGPLSLIICSLLQRLQELHLQENSIELLENQALAGLSSLALLDLSSNQLGTISWEALQPLASLQVLRLTGTSFWDSCTYLPWSPWWQ